ncbi:hypothetical protein HanRHA438_Chr01g0007821 [Helianthus annuus]|nr:hypothetical protein HanRHA438_Chr01g0007821 [Helianthus annuus]
MRQTILFFAQLVQGSMYKTWLLIICRSRDFCWSIIGFGSTIVTMCRLFMLF